MALSPGGSVTGRTGQHSGGVVRLAHGGEARSRPFGRGRGCNWFVARPEGRRWHGEPGRSGSAGHGITLPDCVVRTTTVCCAGAGTVVTTVIGLGALALMTMAPGGGDCPGASWM